MATILKFETPAVRLVQEEILAAAKIIAAKYGLHVQPGRGSISATRSNLTTKLDFSVVGETRTGRRKGLILKIKLKSFKCLPLSETGLSQDGINDISDSSSITFGGGSKHTCYTVNQLLLAKRFTNEADAARLVGICASFGDILIDLEN